MKFIKFCIGAMLFIALLWMVAITFVSCVALFV